MAPSFTLARRSLKPVFEKCLRLIMQHRNKNGDANLCDRRFLRRHLWLDYYATRISFHLDWISVNSC